MRCRWSCGYKPLSLKLKIVELPVPLIYLDESRSFGGSLDDGEIRLGVYRDVLSRAISRSGLAGERRAAASRCGDRGA